jgi:hypothetical protein
MTTRWSWIAVVAAVGCGKGGGGDKPPTLGHFTADVEALARAQCSGPGIEYWDGMTPSLVAPPVTARLGQTTLTAIGCASEDRTTKLEIDYDPKTREIYSIGGRLPTPKVRPWLPALEAAGASDALKAHLDDDFADVMMSRSHEGIVRTYDGIAGTIAITDDERAAFLIAVAR